MASKSERLKNEVIEILSERKSHLLYVLTAIANAIQERIGEDIMLVPRESNSTENHATSVFHYKIGDRRRHFIFYGPAGDPPDLNELLRVTLDVAHELGHLILESGVGYFGNRIIRSKQESQDIIEIECDWFAVCILQMYGFIFPPAE